MCDATFCRSTVRSVCEEGGITAYRPPPPEATHRKDPPPPPPPPFAPPSHASASSQATKSVFPSGDSCSQLIIYPDTVYTLSLMPSYCFHSITYAQILFPLYHLCPDTVSTLSLMPRYCFHAITYAQILFPLYHLCPDTVSTHFLSS